MADFDKKAWLDEHVLPILKAHALLLYHPFWLGLPPKQVLAICIAQPDEDGSLWSAPVKALLDEGWRFDFLREQVGIVMDTGEMFKAFGGDGAPLFNEEGTASCRIFKKVGPDDARVGLTLQIGCRYPTGIMAAAATRAFYAQFKESPLDVCQKYGAVFGAA